MVLLAAAFGGQGHAWEGLYAAHGRRAAQCSCAISAQQAEDCASTDLLCIAAQNCGVTAALNLFCSQWALSVCSNVRASDLSGASITVGFSQGVYEALSLAGTSTDTRVLSIVSGYVPRYSL